MLSLLAASVFAPLALLVLIGCIAWFIVACKRIPRAWAMINQTFAGSDTSRRNPSTCLSTIVAGQPVLIGLMPAVAIDTALNVAVELPSFMFGGTFALSVTATSAVSPFVGVTINPGDKIYADGGTLDAASNMTTGFTLDANSNGKFFGHLDPTGPALASGTTGIVNVWLGASGGA